MPNATKRFYGEIGYAITSVDETGVTKAVLTKRNYYGDVLDLVTRWQNTDKYVGDIRVSHRISILADPYAIENFPFIKYVEWMGTKWGVLSANPDYPRIVLSLGGVYNEDST